MPRPARAGARTLEALAAVLVSVAVKAADRVPGSDRA